MHPKSVQMAQRVRHQPFTAGFIDHTLAPFGDNDFQPGPSTVNRSRQPGGTAADDEEVDHVRPASAASSTLTRVLSSHTLSVENTTAVIHAPCTSGNATPSAITAT